MLRPLTYHFRANYSLTSLLCFNPFFTTQNLSVSQTSSKEITHENPINSLIKSLVQTHKFPQSLFLFKKSHSFTSSLNFDPSVFNSLFRSCSSSSHLDYGDSLHGYLIKCGFTSCIGASLMKMYVGFGENLDAYQVFEEMPKRGEKDYDFAVCGFGARRFFEEVLVVFEEMLALGLFPCFESIRYAIIACGELRRLDKGRWVHSFVVNNGFDRNVLISNLLISMYIKMGKLDLARRTFDGMEERDLVSWNSLITGYAQAGNWADALSAYLDMKELGSVIHNNITLLGLAFCCGQGGYLDQGKSIHGHSIRAGLLSDFRLGTAILDMYVKCGSIECAEMLFEEDAFEKSLVSWNSLISGYSKSGYYDKAAILFKNMFMQSNFKPDSVTLANVIPAYSGLGRVDGIRSIHAAIVKKGLELGADVVLGTAMVDAYGKCFDLTSAQYLFSSIKDADTPTWNAMLTAYYLNNDVVHGILLLRKMLQSQVCPDAVTIVLLLQICGQLGSLKLGHMAHCYSLTKGFSFHLNVVNALLDAYITCRSMADSEQLFRLTKVKNIVTWNTMLSGYVKIASYSSTMRVFSQMQLESQCEPDSVTLICLIQASGAVVSGHGAHLAHAFSLKLGFTSETVVINSLIDAYAKNGIIDDATTLFVHMGRLRDQCSWNLMIGAYGMNGQGEKACQLLKQMNEDGYEPDSITFTSLLSACSHSGMIDEGCRYLDLMTNKYNIRPDLEHWTCIIDMLGRAGRLEEAYGLLTSSLHHNPSHLISLDSGAVWGAFLDACMTYNNIKLGELAGRKVQELSPRNSGYPILLSNLYASTMRWDEAVKARQVFSDGNLVKEPGFSSVKL